MDKKLQVTLGISPPVTSPMHSRPSGVSDIVSIATKEALHTQEILATFIETKRVLITSQTKTARIMIWKILNSPILIHLAQLAW